MIEHLFFAALLGSALGSGLIAGLFFAFSAFVMTALGRLPAAAGASAMRSINVTILNPLFLTLYIGTAIVCLLSIILALTRWGDARAAYSLAGGALYLAGVHFVTVRCNVPLNNALAAAESSGADADDVWRNYLVRWTRWNHVRTIASLAAAALLTLAFARA